MRTRPIVIPSILVLVLLALTACAGTKSAAPASTPTAIPWATDTQSAATGSPASQPVQAMPVTIQPSPTRLAVAKATAESSQAQPKATAAPKATAEATPAPGAPAASAPAVVLTHTVQAGENLYRIGLQHGLGWTELALVNQLADPNRILAGSVLVIPAGAAGAAQALPASHIVEPGQNLFRIGLLYDQSWLTLAQANQLANPNRILVGQVLTIPAAGPAAPPDLPATHLVQPGENLYRIGLLYNVPWTAIAAQNGITNPDRIQAGTTLTIPAPEE